MITNQILSIADPRKFNSLQENIGYHKFSKPEHRGGKKESHN
jgi:hypothetical protein